MPTRTSDLTNIGRNPAGEREIPSRGFWEGFRPQLVAACLWGLTSSPAQGQLFMDFLSSPTISPASPSIYLSIENIGAEPIILGGLDFFITVGNGASGPTMDTSIPSVPNPAAGVDLLTDTPFSGNGFGQAPYLPLLPRSQGWGVLTLAGPSLNPGAKTKIATITFNSVPQGDFPLSFGSTEFFDNQMNPQTIPVMLPNSLLTVVPEPVHYATVMGLAALGLALCRRRGRGKTA